MLQYLSFTFERLKLKNDYTSPWITFVITKKLLLFITYVVSTNKCSIPQARTEYLRKKARAALPYEGGRSADHDEDRRGGSGALEHLNLFPLEESSEKKGNEEYLKEKKDEKVMLLLFMKSLYPKRPSAIT